MARRNYGRLEPVKPRRYRDGICYEDGASDPVEYYQGADADHVIACVNPDTAPCWYVFEHVARCDWRLDHANTVEPRDAREIARRRKLMREHWTLYPGTDKAEFGALMHAVWREFAYRDESEPEPEPQPARSSRIDLDALEAMQEPQQVQAAPQPRRQRFFGVSLTFGK